MSLKARVLLLFSLPLLGFFTHGLFDLDEGFYGAVVAEMNRRGDWITPWFNGAPWFEKPILLYWLSKPLVAIFGFDLGSRLGVVLASIGVAAAVFEFAKRQFGEDVAGTAVLILGSSLLWAALSRMMMTDTLLAGAYGLAVMALWERRYAWTGFCLGLTVLAKGPVGLILITPLFLLWAVREKPSWKGFGWGVLTLVATVASWYVPAYVVNGQLFVQKFLIEQNVQRFLGGDAAHTWNNPLNYLFFVPVLLLGFAPWSFHLPKAWPRGEFGVRTYLAAAGAIPFLFFSLSGAKLVHYILPCFVPLALLVASHLARESEFRWRRAPVIALVVIALLTNVGLPVYYRLSGHAEIHGLARGVAAGENVIVYQMPRRQADRGTGRPKLQETSHPSLAGLLNRVLFEAEEIRVQDGRLWVRKRLGEAETEVPLPATVLTRADRIPLPEGLFPGLEVEITRGENYARYRLSNR